VDGTGGQEGSADQGPQESFVHDVSRVKVAQLHGVVSQD
jgi:hypothetical protein